MDRSESDTVVKDTVMLFYSLTPALVWQTTFVFPPWSINY